MIGSDRPGMGLARDVAWHPSVLIAGRTHGRMEAASCRRILNFYARRQEGEGKEESSFLKKRSKRLLLLAPTARSRPISSALGPRSWAWRGSKSLLVLFFRKERLACLGLAAHIARG
jgi:hypothetical protein